jgi:hypothetical protein
MCQGMADCLPTILVGAAKRLKEPGPSERPVSVGRAQGDPQRFRGLLGCQTREVAQLNDLGRLRLLGGKAIEGLIQCNQLVGRLVARDPELIEIDSLPFAAMAGPALAPG